MQCVIMFEKYNGQLFHSNCCDKVFLNTIFLLINAAHPYRYYLYIIT